jgi:hypothetical protein
VGLGALDHGVLAIEQLKAVIAGHDHVIQKGAGHGRVVVALAHDDR